MFSGCEAGKLKMYYFPAHLWLCVIVAEPAFTTTLYIT